jgi:hypothetical protein
MAIARSYTGKTAHLLYGAPRTPRPTRFEDPLRSGIGMDAGSDMPIDAEIHWSWRNPLNILPALVLIVFVYALIGTLFF